MTPDTLRAELLRIAVDCAPAGLLDLLLDWYRAVGECGQSGIDIVEHESGALVAALSYPPDDDGRHGRMLVLAEANIVMELRMSRFLRCGSVWTRPALEAVRDALVAEDPQRARRT